MSFSRTSFPKSRYNDFTHGQMGVSVPALERERLLTADMHAHSSKQLAESQELLVTFDIWDMRAQPKTVKASKKGEGEGDAAVGSEGTEAENEPPPETTRKYVVVLTR